jgi:hypothetical protein
MKVGSLVKTKPVFAKWAELNPWMTTPSDRRVGIVLDRRTFTNGDDYRIKKCKVFINNSVFWVPENSLETINESR